VYLDPNNRDRKAYVETLWTKEKSEEMSPTPKIVPLWYDPPKQQ